MKKKTKNKENEDNYYVFKQSDNLKQNKVYHNGNELRKWKVMNMRAKEDWI